MIELIIHSTEVSQKEQKADLKIEDSDNMFDVSWSSPI